jgi:hypothetical protein
MNLKALIGCVLSLSLTFGCGPVDPSSDGGSGGGTATGGGSATGGGGGGGGGGIAMVPTVTGSVPSAGAVNVALNGNVQLTFSEPMNAATLTGMTFTVSSGTPAVAMAGTVITSQSRATFRPNANFAANTVYTVRLAVGAQSGLGVPLATEFVSTFTTGWARRGTSPSSRRRPSPLSPPRRSPATSA